VVHKPVVKVLATQVSVTVGGFHLENALLSMVSKHIEGVSAIINFVFSGGIFSLVVFVFCLTDSLTMCYEYG
jgi:hypothetical protein